MERGPLSPSTVTPPHVTFVIDASVAVKWFSGTEEDDLDLALKLQGLHLKRGCLLTAPDLLVYEVVNALRYNPHFKQRDTELAFQSLQKMHLGLIVPGVKEIERAIALAYRNKITFYDAAYLALAQERQLFFVTADLKFYQKVEDLPQVLLLRDLRL